MKQSKEQEWTFFESADEPYYKSLSSVPDFVDVPSMSRQELARAVVGLADSFNARSRRHENE